MSRTTSRRRFLQSAALPLASLCSPIQAGAQTDRPLEEFGYGDVDLAPGLAQTQFEQTQAALLSLNEDSLLRPWRLRAGQPAPGPDLGGWYDDQRINGGEGFAPGHCFGQWLSALARGYAVHPDARTRARLERLLALYEPAISGRFYTNFRFPTYNYDKMVLALIDAHQFAGLPQAFDLLERTTNAALPHLPPQALDREEPQRRWRKSIGENTGDEYTWDESYTLPENLFLAWQRGAGDRYRTLAARFLLDETYFDPLSRNENVLPKHHAYSFCNALSSAMQAYLAAGSRKHLQAAVNAFEMIVNGQSFATGGWGPDESFIVPGSGALYESLKKTHQGFETPCGSYAHCKLTRYLLRVTRNGRYGDSMERVLYNTVLGAKPLLADGHAFYYSDYHSPGRKSYFPEAWPCCSGTLPQIAADYRILIYLHDPEGVFVNLYLPSTLRWTNTDGSRVTLDQSGNYPLDGKIAIRLRTSRPSPFALRLRIPAWSPGSILRLNGRPITPRREDGFAILRRTWRDGDRIELELALPLRLEAIDEQHPNTVALVRGPLVLFAMAEDVPPVSRQLLLAPTQMQEPYTWRAATPGRPLLLRPFIAINDERYRTYLTVT